MKKHIRAFYISLFTAFCVCLVLACQNPFDSPDKGEGTFSLIIGNAGRTILPATVLDNFALYTLVFSSTGRENISVERNNTNLTDSITLSVATWNLTVTAYTDNGRTKPVAQGSIDGIVIDAGANVSRSLELKPIVKSGAKGTFIWNIVYPRDVKTASMKITPLDPSGTPEQELYFKGGTPSVGDNNPTNPLYLNTGYYQVMFSLSNGERNIGMEEYLHIYENMVSRFEYTFTQGHFTIYSVTNGNDSGPGSLRHAIQYAATNSTILVESSVGTIKLTKSLSIERKNLTIAGNGVTITRDPSWTTINNGSQLLSINNSNPVTISRTHFKDGRAINGSAIEIYNSSVNLESCIFSENQSTGNGTIFNYEGTLSVKGCTFYGNVCLNGGVVFNFPVSSITTLTGNLFYGNTAKNYPVIYYFGTITSTGYNVVDVHLGTGTNQSGWVAHNNDKVIDSQPIAPASFKLISGRGVQNVIASLPSGYPTVDFYGNPILANAAAGAVQQATASGYLVELSVNDSTLGSAAITSAPALNPDGLYAAGASVELTATPKGTTGYGFQYWMVNNSQQYASNPLTLTLNGHCKVRAVFNTGIELADLDANNKDFAIEARLDATQWSNVTSKLGYAEVLRKISNKVYEKYNDDFDFIFFVLNTEKDNTIISALGGLSGVNVGVSNNVQGLGKEIYSEASSYGSAGQLKSLIYFTYHDGILRGPALHEIAHTWGAHICPTYTLEASGDVRFNPHWGISNAGGQLGGFKEARVVSKSGGTTEYQGSISPDEKNPDGSYKKGFGDNANGGNGIPYSDIELYLMGMIGADELRKKGFHLDIYSGLSVPDTLGPGYFKATDITSYTIDDLINLNGNEPRVPDVSDSQKTFKVLTVILSKSQDTTASTRHDKIVKDVKWLAGLHNDTENLPVWNFEQATRGKGSLVVGEITKSRK